MEKKYRFWMGLACFMTGIVLGFLLSPVKNGVSIGNNSCNEYGKLSGREEEPAEEDEDAIAF